MFDTCGSSLADDVECSLPDDLPTATVNDRLGSAHGDGKPRGYP